MHKPQFPHIFTRRKSSRSIARCQSARCRRILHVSASAVVCSERFLPSHYPPWTRFGEGEAGLQASSPEAEVETRGSSAGLSVRLKAGRAPVAWPTSTRSWWVTLAYLWLLVFQDLDRCPWRLLSGRQILLAQSAVSIMISLPLPPPPPPPPHLSLSIYLFRSPSLSRPLPVSLSLSLSHTHTHNTHNTHISLCLYFAFHTQAHQCICMVEQSQWSVLLLCWCLLTQHKL